MTRASDRRRRIEERMQRIRIAELRGFEAVKPRDILAAEAAAPMRGGDADLPHKSLFGDSHLQRELF